MIVERTTKHVQIRLSPGEFEALRVLMHYGTLAPLPEAVWGELSPAGVRAMPGMTADRNWEPIAARRGKKPCVTE